jgi:enterochelin esterase-like enzyme
MLPLSCTDEGTRQGGSVESPTAGSIIRFQVYLPPCYDQETSLAYPVVYLLDGNRATWNQYGAARIAEDLILDRRVPPFILITPGIATTEERCAAVASDLPAEVDGGFRTLADRRHRAVAGASSCGHTAACAALQFPDRFGSVGIFGSGIFGEDVEEFSGWIAATPLEQQPRIWIDTGEQDEMMPYTNLLIYALTSEGVAVTYVSEPGGHQFEYWASHLEAFYLWLAEGW